MWKQSTMPQYTQTQEEKAKQLIFFLLLGEVNGTFWHHGLVVPGHF